MRRIAGGIAVLVGLLVAAPAVAAHSAQPGELDGFEYVALGDSYSAGFGLTPYSATSPFAATPPSDPNGCYQADANYPHLVTTALGLTIDDQTCSGAISANIGYPSSATIPVTPVIDTLPELPTVPTIQTTMSGQTALQLQTAALSADTDIVTVAIGGNDLGFTDIAEACMRTALGGNVTGLLFLTGGTYATENCANYFTTATNTPAFPADANLENRMTTLIAPRISATFDEIAALAPNAQVFVVEYPQIASADATDACFSAPFTTGGSVPFSGVDIQYIHTVQGWLNQAMEDAAIAHGFHWVETEESTSGHSLCSDDPWIANLDIQLASGGVCPPGWMPLGQDGNVYACVALGALHPNEAGVANLAALVQQAVNDAFGTSVSVGSVAPGAGLTVSGVGFRPGEQVEVVLHSTPATLGTFTAGAGGAFSAAVTVPADVDPGAHTVVSTGLTSGRAFSAALTIELAATGGSDSSAPLLLGLCFVTAGFLLVSARRARPSGPAR